MSMTLSTDDTDGTGQSAAGGLRISDFRTMGCGLLMGAADIVPGVSGGTVALILGIYHRLVTAISHFDRELIRHLASRRWRAAAEHVELRFVVALGCGIVTGIGGLSFLMHYLLEQQAQHTNGVFFGLILASGLIVSRSISKWTPTQLAALTLGTVGAFIVVGLEMFQNPPDTMWYLFLSGMISICAMILPGISGAFILLILGTYAAVTGLLRDVLKNALRLSLDFDEFLQVTVFCLGCLTGLLAFSRLLRWLLARHEEVTLASLCGLMLGSLRKIWPFKIDLTPDETKIKLKRFDNVLPESFDGSAMITIGLGIVALVLVLWLESRSRKGRSVEPAA